jgi:thiol-disulfide isomerase/thioredoxin
MRRTTALQIGMIGVLLAGCAPRADQKPSGAVAASVADSVVAPLTADQLLALVHRGESRATLVNVWATWCIPCRQEFPALLRVARAHSPRDLRLVLVSADFEDQLPGVHRFLAQQGVRDTTYLKTGDDMTFIQSMEPRWTGSLPATFVYDRSGRLVSFWEGAADTARFEHAITAALTSSEKESRP